MRETRDVTVLVVDDDADVTTYLGTILEDAGMHVMTAHDGAEALEQLRERVPDLISLDLVMPGKSGIRLLHELRKHPAWARIPVIVVTGHARDELVKRDLASVLADSSISGPSLYLEKPVTPQKYLEAVCLATGATLSAEPAEQDGASDLRAELESLLRTADDATLTAALAALRAGKKRS